MIKRCCLPRVENLYSLFIGSSVYCFPIHCTAPNPEPVQKQPDAATSDILCNGDEILNISQDLESDTVVAINENQCFPEYNTAGFETIPLQEEENNESLVTVMNLILIIFTGWPGQEFNPGLDRARMTSIPTRTGTKCKSPPGSGSSRPGPTRIFHLFNHFFRMYTIRMKTYSEYAMCVHCTYH